MVNVPLVTKPLSSLILPTVQWKDFGVLAYLILKSLDLNKKIFHTNTELGIYWKEIMNPK